MDSTGILLLSLSLSKTAIYLQQRLSLQLLDRILEQKKSAADKCYWQKRLLK